MNGEPSKHLETPANVKAVTGVQESRTKRLQRQQSRFRDRGGIFVPTNRHTLVDILLGRKTAAKQSPTKARGRSSSCSPSKKGKQKQNGGEGPYTLVNQAEKSAGLNKVTLEPISEEPLTGPGSKRAPRKQTPRAAKAKASVSTAGEPGDEGPQPSRKRRGRPPKPSSIAISKIKKSNKKTIRNADKSDDATNIPIKESDEDAKGADPPKVSIKRNRSKKFTRLHPEDQDSDNTDHASSYKRLGHKRKVEVQLKTINEASEPLDLDNEPQAEAKKRLIGKKFVSAHSPHSPQRFHPKPLKGSHAESFSVAAGAQLMEKSARVVSVKRKAENAEHGQVTSACPDDLEGCRPVKKSQANPSFSSKTGSKDKTETLSTNRKRSRPNVPSTEDGGADPLPSSKRAKEASDFREEAKQIGRQNTNPRSRSRKGKGSSENDKPNKYSLSKTIGEHHENTDHKNGISKASELWEEKPSSGRLTKRTPEAAEDCLIPPKRRKLISNNPDHASSENKRSAASMGKNTKKKPSKATKIVSRKQKENVSASTPPGNSKIKKGPPDSVLRRIRNPLPLVVDDDEPDPIDFLS